MSAFLVEITLLLNKCRSKLLHSILKLLLAVAIYYILLYLTIILNLINMCMCFFYNYLVIERTTYVVIIEMLRLLPKLAQDIF